VPHLKAIKIPSPTDLKVLSAYSIFRTMTKRDWKFMRTKNFIIKSNCKWDLIKKIAYFGEKFLIVQSQFFKLKPQKTTIRLIIFNDIQQFLQFAKGLGILHGKSFYNLKTSEAILYLQDKDKFEEFLPNLFHEISHIYVHLLTGKTTDVWFLEGLAECFSFIKIENNKLFFPFLNKSRIAFVKFLHQTKKLINFKKFIQISEKNFYKDNIRAKYLQAYSIVCYLLLKDKTTFDKILHNLVNNLPIFYKIDTNLLEQRWIKFIYSNSVNNR
jgi:hypothetical protein